MIELVVFDFDGVFTDGKILFDNNGYAIKHYNSKDGNAIFRLKDNNILTGVISGWKNNTSQKCILEHLKFDKISLGSDNKLSILINWCKELNISLEDVAYIGDDLNDLEIMNSDVGLKCCPNDAADEIKEKVHYICSKNGGKGAVREYCEYIFKILSRNEKKISCIIPCAKTNVENINIRKISNTTLLDIKIDTIKNIDFDEIIISSNDENIKNYDNILIHKRDDILCNNNVKYTDLYNDHFKAIHNSVLFHTAPTSPFISVKTINNIINIWKNNPQYEMVIFGKKHNNILKKNTNYLTLQQGGFILDKETFLKYDCDISKIQNIHYICLSDVETIVIKNNTDFVIAESLLYRNLNKQKLIDDYMLNSTFKQTKILDCTIRDSGYLNNWNWSYDTVKDFVYYMGEIGVEYCEIGFILDENYSEPNCGIWRNLNKDFSIISKLKSETNTKTKIVVMFDIGDYDKYNYDYTLIPEQKETQIDLIRVCCFYKILQKTKDVILNLKSKGYNLTLNIMYASHLSKNDIIESKEFVKNLPIEYLYFADSIGGLTGNDTAKFFVNLKDIHPIKNGFHNHDNNGTVFNNIDNILKSNIDIIDTTIQGFGKNGGNSPFELIMLYLIIKENYPYDIYKLLEFLNKLQDTTFYEDKTINIIMIKEMLQQFLNIHPSHVKQYNNLNLLEYYNSIKSLKGKSKW